MITRTDLLDLIRRYGETYRTHGRGFSGAEIRRVDRQAGEVFDEIEAAVAALKADRDHLFALLGNCAAGLRLSLAGHTDAATPLQNIEAARELLRQADEALANYEGVVPWATS